jgi:PAS domain S-box-containing protein
MAKQVSRGNEINEAQRLQRLVDSIEDYAIYLLDLDGFITSWNSGAQRIKGYSSSETIGKHFSRFFTAEDQQKGLPQQILARARALGRSESEGWRIRKDGSRFWCNAITQPVRGDDGSLVGFSKITRDISERRAAHDALVESERRFRMLVEGVVDYAIYMLDPSGVVVNWNPGAQRLKGYASTEIVGQHFSRFYTKEDRAIGLPARVLDTAVREGRYEAEGWRVRKDGSRFWASVVVDAIRNHAGGLEGFAKVTRDVTERRSAQEALRDSERQFRLLVAGVSDYALYMLDPNGIVTSWNAGACRIKGYAAEEIIGQHFSRFYTPGDRATGLPARALNTALQVGRFESEGWRVRKNGTLFWANVVVDPIRDENGALVGFAKITRDITERRDTQLQLQEAQTQRAQAQKMDALGQLTGGVAHDFNNLLMIIGGQVRTIRKRLDDQIKADPRVARAVDAIETAARSGAALTRQLLTFSRRQSFTPSVFELADRIKAFRPMLKSALGGTTALAVMIDPATWRVKVDASELELAVVNLALNARDAMSGSGTVTLTAENVVLSAPDTSARIAGEFVVLRVSDTGVGIAPDVLAKVFDPFFTTKQVGKGSGLGLSQVYGFAQQAGGTVAIESELGKGTTVALYLPRTHEPIGEALVHPEPAPSGGGRVLVVEDNPEVAQVTVGMLEQLGYDAHAVTNAAAALDAIGAWDFALVVSDIVMPGAMNGIGLAKAIKERKPDLPILLVTGYSNSPSEEFTVLRKPLDPDELGVTAARLIAAAKDTRPANVVPLRPGMTSPTT